jgi:Gpi18-like mannosyltransferase
MRNMKTSTHLVKQRVQQFVDWMSKYQFELIAAGLFALGVYIRFDAFSFISGDYMFFLRPWMNQIVQGGGWASLSTSIGDYTPPYMYLLTLLSYFPSASDTHPFLFGIKFYSLMFDGLLAFAVYLNVKLIVKDHQHYVGLMASLIVFFLPTVVLNSAFWGQIDASYAAFALFSLYYLQKHQFFKSVIWFAVGLSFKLQTIFILPVFILYLWFVKRSIWYYVFLIPLVYFALAIPSIIAGRSIVDIALIYVNQAGSYRALTLNMPNVYQWLPNRYDDLSGYGIALFVSLMGLVFLWMTMNKQVLKPNNILSIAFWSVLMANFFLPAMHERYLYMADILAILVIFQFKKDWIFVLIVQFISLLAYTPFLFGTEIIQHQDVAFVFLALLSFVTILLYRQLRLVHTKSLVS